MHDAFAALLRQPTARRYKQLRTQLLASESLGEFSLCLAELQADLEGQHLSQASALLAELLPAGLLSLSLHRLGGQLALQQGDRERAELHRFTYDALTSAILATGDGTRRRPLLITYSSDEAELLAARGCEVLSQCLVKEDARQFDVLLCRGEREFWFDVSDLLPQTAVAAVRNRRNFCVAAERSAIQAASRVSRRDEAVRVTQGNERIRLKSR